MELGNHNPFPASVGGGPSTTRRMYEAMRSAWGNDRSGNSAAGPEGGIVDSWRLAMAHGLALMLDHAEAALEQHFPQSATYYLGLWEELLRVPQEATLVARQRAVHDVYATQVDASVPSILEALVTIDPASSVDAPDFDGGHQSQFGKWLAGASGLALYGPRGHGAYPNSSSDAEVRVRVATQDSREAIAEMLNRRLPAWAGFSISDTNAAFYLDGFQGSALDITRLGS